MQQVSISDPTWTRTDESFFERFCLRFINDVRDVPFIKLSALLTATVVANGVGLFVFHFSWWRAALQIALVLWFVGPYILMLHNTSHRKFFKTKYAFFNHYIPWVLGPFFGESPDTYFAHHIGMHHPENNLEEDLSTTLPYVRDSVWGFTQYFCRFFFGVLIELPQYFIRKKRISLAWKGVVGELLFFAMVAGLCFLDWKSTVGVFVVPYLFARFGMMAGNWGQHAFVAKEAPECCYRNSITCINSAYNRRCFNDGYHIGHHVKQTRHWTEMPKDFTDNIAVYAEKKAIVFEGIDFFMVWLFLMLKRYDILARKMVDLGGEPMTHEERITLMRSRTQWTGQRATFG